MDFPDWSHLVQCGGDVLGEDVHSLIHIFTLIELKPEDVLNSRLKLIRFEIFVISFSNISLLFDEGLGIPCYNSNDQGWNSGE